MNAHHTSFALQSHRTTPVAWATARLFLGTVNVGFWMAAAAVWLWMAPPVSHGPLWAQVLVWAAVVAGYALVQLPFDVVGGYALPVLHQRRDSGLRAWLVEWSRGVLLHGGALFVMGALAMLAASTIGTGAGLAVLFGFALLLVASQAWLARLAARMHVVTPSADLERALVRLGLDPVRTWVVRASDPGVVGGWYGPRGMERLVVSERWSQQLGEEALSVVLKRRVIAKTSGARSHGVLAALGFNALGLLGVLAVVPGASLSSVGGLMTVAAGTTLWGGAGVLALPAVSRWAVRTLDRLTADSVGDSLHVARALRQLERDQDDRTDSRGTMQTELHPVPAPAQRAMALRYPVPYVSPVIPWRVASMSLFTSWASLSLVTRSAHWNVGRPDLWVMYPGD